MKLGSTLLVSNDAAFPYPSGTPTLPGDPWATVMQISVSKKPNTKLNPATRLTRSTVLRGLDAGTPLLPTVTSVPRGLTVRKIMLGEGCDEYGRVMPLIGTVAEGTKRYQDPPDIFPALGSTEVWEFWNSTADSHPIHMHLVRFRAINRQQFKGRIQEKLLSNGWAGVKFSAPPEPTTDPVHAPAGEQGWKDTIVCPPGYITRVLVNFTRPGKYVYHCHILGHEEHDMMRWFEVR
jgi:spore coat protein A